MNPHHPPAPFYECQVSRVEVFGTDTIAPQISKNTKLAFRDVVVGRRRRNEYYIKQEATPSFHLMLSAPSIQPNNQTTQSINQSLTVIISN